MALSYYRLKKHQNRQERDEIYNFLLNCEGDDVEDEAVVHLCFMDGGNAKIRLSLYEEFLKLVHKEGEKSEVGLNYYFVERLPDKNIARLYIDLDLYVGSQDLIPSEETMKTVTHVIQKAAQDAWCLKDLPPYAVASAEPREERRYIGDVSRKLKRMDTSQRDLENFFHAEGYQETSVYKVGVHWIFPTIVDHADNLQAFANHLKDVLNEKVDPMELFGVVAGWNDAVDLAIYNGGDRGAFRLPYCCKAKGCTEKPAFRFDSERQSYVATEEGTRPPTMRCQGIRSIYQGRDVDLAKKYNKNKRLVNKDKRMPDELDSDKYPDFIGKSRAKKLLQQGIEVVNVNGVDLSVRCDMCKNEGYASIHSFYVPCSWSELLDSKYFSIVPLGSVNKPLGTFGKELLSKYKLESNDNTKKRKKSLTTTLSKKIAKADKFDSSSQINLVLTPACSSLFKAMMEELMYSRRREGGREKYHPFKETADDMENTITLQCRRGLTPNQLCANLKKENPEPPVRLWVYDDTHFCPVRFIRNGRGDCHHQNNRSYVEISCLGIKSQCLDTGDSSCYPNGRKSPQGWRTNESHKAFWKKFIEFGIREPNGPLCFSKIGYSIYQVETNGMKHRINQCEGFKKVI